MAVVPYTFANQAGQIPLSELDVNFANVKAFAETAGNVTSNIQANITALGTLVTLSVTGNIVAARLIGNVIGNVTGNVSGTITAAGLNTQVLFNDNGVTNATAGMTFDKVNSNFSVANTITSLITTSALTIANNINVTDTLRTGTMLANTGIIGVPPGTNTLFLGNTICNTVFFAGHAGDIHIGNVNSTTKISGNATVGGTVSATGNITTPGHVTGSNVVATTLTGTLTTGLQTNITAVGTLNSLSVAGNITGGSLSATGNITGGNIIGTIVGTVATTSVSASGNIDGGNLRTVGLVSATGNVTGSNIQTAGQISAGGNIIGGNIIGTIVGTVATTSVSASGNIDGGNLRTTGSVSATGSVILQGTLSAAGNTVLSGNAVAVTASPGTSTTQLATTAFVTNAVNSAIPTVIPPGLISLWFGSVASIPAGWALCNGGSGTPNLQDRFVVGAGNGYAVNATGGSANATVVAHTHGATSVVSDPGHAHTYTSPSGFDNGGISGGSVVESIISTNTGSASTGITVSTTIASAGSSGTGANLPPYYALAYIMKL